MAAELILGLFHDGSEDPLPLSFRNETEPQGNQVCRDGVVVVLTSFFIVVPAVEGLRAGLNFRLEIRNIFRVAGNDG